MIVPDSFFPIADYRYVNICCQEKILINNIHRLVRHSILAIFHILWFQ